MSHVDCFRRCMGGRYNAERARRLQRVGGAHDRERIPADRTGTGPQLLHSSATWGSAIRVGRVEADHWPSKSAMVSAVWKCIACSADEKSTAEVRQLPYPLHSSNNDISEVGLSNGNPAAEAGVQCSGSGRNEKWRLPLSYCKPTQTKRQTC